MRGFHHPREMEVALFSFVIKARLAANSIPGIYQWHLSVFTVLENTPQVAYTGKLNFFALNYSRNVKQDDLKQYNRIK